MLRKILSSERGDTIIEVLIAMAILALVLGGAYYTASSSYRNDRDSQEHTQALDVAQSQLETLKALGANGTLFTPSSTSLCVDVSTVQPTTDCYINSNNTQDIGTACSSTAPYCYKAKITYPSYVGAPTQPITVSGASLYTYIITVTWPALGGGGTDSVTLYYRLDTT